MQLLFRVAPQLALLTLLVPNLLPLVKLAACSSTDLPTTLKVDCHPDKEASEARCIARGCLWSNEFEEKPINHDQPPNDIQRAPSCYFPSNFRCYEIVKQISGNNEPSANSIDDPSSSSNENKDENHKSLKLLLKRRSSCPASGFAADGQSLELSLSIHDDSIVNIKISDLNGRRFEPRLPEIRLPEQRVNSKQRKTSDGKLRVGKAAIVEFGQDQDSRSVLKVIHEPSGVLLFATDLGKLIYSQKFIQLTTYLPSPLVYGLGQHMGNSLFKSLDQVSTSNYAKSYTMFNFGYPPDNNGKTAYSTFPFYINLAKLSHKSEASTSSNSNNHDNDIEPSVNGTSSSSEVRRRFMATGALMLNSNAMDVLLHPNVGQSPPPYRPLDSEAAITWRLVGGVVNLYLFMGPQPHDVIAQYQNLVGRPQLPPAWALGYHQSRFNYKDLMGIKMSWFKTRSAGIPMESVWTDLDFMRRQTSYTLNNPELNDLVGILQKDFDMHYVTLADPAISLREDLNTYEALKMAEALDLFAYYPPSRTNDELSEGSTAVVTNWADSGHSGVLDFTHPKSVNYLRQVLGEFSKNLSFNGLWLDMNEPEVFANEVMGSDGQTCIHDDELQYEPGNRKLNERTLCMAAEFSAGKHYDLHNLYAFYQSKAHFEAMKILEPNKRPFIISRSQFVGQGKYSGSWLGDLASDFRDLRWSLLGTIESSFFGQPLTGADICGFFRSTTDELCARWFSLGAFYPLARNHNDGTARDQDPGSLDETVQMAARVALLRRYSLLPYLYTLFQKNHLSGEPVIRSVLFQFFDQFHLNDNLELNHLPQVDDQLMFGPAFMVAPVMVEGANSRSVYMPPGRWYDVSLGLPGTNMNQGIYDALVDNWPSNESQSSGRPSEDQAALRRVKALRQPIDISEERGSFLLDQFTPVGSVNVYLRGGHIVPTFRRISHEQSINRMWKNATFFLEAGLNAKDEAFGSLIWDSGESEPEAERHNLANFWLSHNRLSVSCADSGFVEPLQFEGFMVYGLKSFNEPPEDKVLYRGARLVYNYNQEAQTLSCVFKSPDEEKTQPLAIGKFDKLVFRW